MNACARFHLQNELLFAGSGFSKRENCRHNVLFRHKIRSFELHCSSSEHRTKVSKTGQYRDTCTLTSRRNAIGLGLVISTLGLNALGAKGAGLPPEEKPRLCDAACEKELENVW